MRKKLSCNLNKHCSIKRLIITNLLIILIYIPLPALNNVQATNDSAMIKKTIILNNKKNKLAPVEYFTKDSIFNDTETGEETDKPGASSTRKHTALQDSTYYRAMKLKIPASVRLSYEFKLFTQKMELQKEIENGLPWQIALENLRIRPDILAPLPHDIVHRHEMIERSLYVPFMPNLKTNGLSVSLQDIGVFLGVSEDVSPVMNYDINYTEEVEIVIYSVQAVVVATVFKGMQQAGHHKIVWNGRDEYGRPMPSGDYIGEIRIGNTRFKRKRITLP